ncbi:unnamed protein product [Pieris brassicae]|uniref:Homeobox domain-containing protein n=1 Tax=Pieris brassicae TaxID=7116 RepID=A0A9P0X0A4_PIEBR|nr:unnamed protein product [Pieris brassicae]
MNELTSWENRPFHTIWPEKNQLSDKDSLVTKIVRKKNKRMRTAYTTDQLHVLENAYRRKKYVDAEGRHELAKRLNVSDKCVKVWFQNRRMKEKKESSESSDTSSESSLIEPVTPPSPVSQPLSEKNNVHKSLPEEIQYPDTYIFPQEIQNNFEGLKQQYCNNAYNSYASGFYFQNDVNIYPTQYYPTNSTHYYQPSDIYHYGNCIENGYEWPTSTFNINEFQV